MSAWGSRARPRSRSPARPSIRWTTSSRRAARSSPVRRARLRAAGCGTRGRTTSARSTGTPATSSPSAPRSRSTRPAPRWSLAAGVDYDLANTWFGNADAAVRYVAPLDHRRWRAPAIPAPLRPVDHLGCVQPGALPRGERGRLAAPAAARSSCEGAGSATPSRTTETETPLVTWTMTAGGSESASRTPRRRAWTLDAGYREEYGPGASSHGFEGTVTFLPTRTLSLTAYGSTLDRPLEFRFEDASVDAFGLDAEWSPTDRLRLAIGGARYCEDSRSARRRGVRLGPDPAPRPGDAAVPERDAMSLRCPPALRTHPRAGSAGEAPGAWRLAWSLLVGGCRGSALALRCAQQRFDHWQHRALFPSCLGCHAGAPDPSRSLWPQPSRLRRVPRRRHREGGGLDAARRAHAPSNLRFTHQATPRRCRGRAAPIPRLRCAPATPRAGADPCRSGRPRWRTASTVTAVTTAHLEAPDTACVTCHVPLVQAVRLTRGARGGLPGPGLASRAGLPSTRPWEAARAGRGEPVAASCATCHARDYCTECHVNAPEVPAIQALGPIRGRWRSRRSSRRRPVTPTRRSSSGTGAGPERGRRVRDLPHAGELRRVSRRLARGSVQAMHAAGPGRGPGAVVQRERPASHGADFSETHAEPASARPQSCSACHARPECLDCHRPRRGRSAPGLPSRRVPHHPSRRGVHPGELLRRVPQPGRSSAPTAT